jgi:hypothetical protein
MSFFKELFAKAQTEQPEKAEPVTSPREKQEVAEPPRAALKKSQSGTRSTGKTKYKEVARERRLYKLRTWEDQRKSKPSQPAASAEGGTEKKRRRVKQKTRFREKQRYYNDPRRGGVEGYAISARAVESCVRRSAKKLKQAQDGTPLAAIAQVNDVTSFRTGFYEIVQAFFDDHANEIVEIAATAARKARGTKEGSGVVCFEHDIKSSIDHIVSCRNQ